MNNSTYKVVTYAIGFAILTFAMAHQYQISNRIYEQEIFLIINCLTVIAAILFLIYGKYQQFQLYDCFFIFYLIFFGLVPPIELLYGSVYWGATGNPFKEYYFTAIIGLLSILLFHIVYSFHRGRRRRESLKPVSSYVCRPVVLIALSVSTAFVILAVNNFSLASVLFRGGEFVSRVSLNQQVHLIFQSFIYPIPCICLVVYLNSVNKNLIISFILLAIFLMFNPITGMARFQAATLYVAVLISFFRALLFRKIFMQVILLFGFFFIFPILNSFRRYKEGLTIEIGSLDFIYGGHFDGFQSFSWLLRREIVTNGDQLMGVLFFFVPRSLWPDKPLSSGTYLANELRFFFDNISLNFLAEGYINFGYVGVIVFVYALAGFCAIYDRSFWRHGVKVYSSGSVFYLFLLGFLFFLLRGSLMIVVGYGLALYMAVCMVFILGTRQQRMVTLNYEPPTVWKKFAAPEDTARAV